MRRLAFLALATIVPLACTEDDTAKPGVSSGDSVVESTTTVGVVLEQVALWPASDVVATTPEETARDFVFEILKVPPVLGEFAAGDSRSGEMSVLSPGGGNVSRGLLMLRQLGPADGWFVIGVANPNATIVKPAAGSLVTAGPLTVRGEARGFEGHVAVSAFLVDDEPRLLDETYTQGGSAEEPEPYSVELDLSQAPTGATVLILVRGGRGLETDPGDFGAIAVTIE